MSSRQSISRRQGRAVLAKSQALHIGISSDYRAYGVRIDWTDAKVVRIEARRDMQIEVIEAAVMRGELREGKHFQYRVQAGDVLYFARSSHGNFYYIARWAGDHFCCSCPAAHKCHHQEAVMAYALQSAENRKRMAEEADCSASDTPRMEYDYVVIEGVCYPGFSVSGGEWKQFLNDDGTGVAIESVSLCEQWLAVYQQSSQVEADLWLEMQMQSAPVALAA
jgi:hypothetical protein